MQNGMRISNKSSICCPTKFYEMPAHDQTHHCHSPQMHSNNAPNKETERLPWRLVCAFLRKVVFAVHCETKLYEMPTQDQTHQCHSQQMHSNNAPHKETERLPCRLVCAFLTKVVFAVYCKTKFSEMPAQDQTRHCHSPQMHSIGAYHKDAESL
jgi:hypothetical protein